LRGDAANRKSETMRGLMTLVRQLKSDEDGATLIEYTVLLAIILVAVIAIIAAVGAWVNTQWANLNTAI
jgi:pilus assembly protein Flp/PilA